MKSVLISIAGTTASALGQIRQSLYDKTDGAESLNRLNGNGICTWEEAVTTLVDSRTVFADSEASQQNRFSLWSSLFSHTFSSLVHSLLTTSFQSVHTSVVSTLRVSLANAPPISSILPHEAYRNTLKLATDLDRSLLKVSEDAHELLVHAEERVESERRLRQSLYVQTCEIMGRLICELRRMIHRAENDNSDATRELIVGRLCFLLKFRLPSLRFLLSPDSSPASMNSTSGMISFIDLQTAFELADDNEEGVISFEDAMEAVESAFAGTPFHGAEILRETLILSTEGKRLAVNHPSASLESPSNVTLHELTLLTARGLRHDRVGALPAVQFALDKIIDESLGRWAKLTMDVSSNVLKENVANFFGTASTVSNDEWVRMFSNSSPRETFTCRGVSPHWVGFFLDMISALNSSTCPPDFLTPVPTDEYATSLGCTLSGTVPTCVESLRRALLVEVFDVALRLLEESVLSESGSRFTINGAAATVQLHVDVSFLNSALQRYLLGHVALNRSDPFKQRFYAIVQRVDNWTQTHCTKEMLTTLTSSTNDNQNRVFETSDLFFSTLSGNSLGTSVPAVADFVESSEGTTPMFHGPLLSSRRFTLLPVQTDRSINDIQLRGTYAKEKERTSQKPDTSSGNVISGGFGFLSNMLKTKK